MLLNTDFLIKDSFCLNVSSTNFYESFAYVGLIIDKFVLVYGKTVE